VGIGSNANNRKNGLEVTTDGTVKILMSGSQVSLQQKLADLSTAISGGIDATTIDNAASNAVENIQAANDLEGIKTNLIQFIQSFRKQ
jgi:hypothetical protein